MCRFRTINKDITRVNQVVRGWINYFKTGSMKIFLSKFGQWLRHKIRCVIINNGRNQNYF
ncbi:group II intron maturase-specific domain-containing protein [[Clostridium] innocuum]|uniref:group II intron maturase-specific domain-containing protein n=1 Tax=Clostridium innocuum TaxID=1522 RepID=UPI003B0174DE